MFILRTIIGFIFTLAMYGALLFLPAGTWDWWRAWVIMGLLVTGSIVTHLALLPGSREVLAERLKFPIQKGQPLADKLMVPLLLASYFGSIAFISLDVFRYRFFPKPGLLISSLGLLLFVAGWILASLALHTNAFASSVVRLQAERKHRVIDTGVYGIVRHPLYAGAVPMLLGLALWLESYAAALFMILPILLIALRIGIEEKLLRKELEGYEAYMRKVRYRLIPGVW